MAASSHRAEVRRRFACSSNGGSQGSLPTTAWHKLRKQQLQKQQSFNYRSQTNPRYLLSASLGLRAGNASDGNRVSIIEVAEKELENLEKWKEQHRAKPVNLVPRRLGGSQSEAEVRQKQQLQLMQSKYQQKLKREESIRIKKEAEEAEIQKMKAIQREKARRQAYKDSLKEEENRKLQRMKEEQHQKSELLEFKRQQQEEERIRTQQDEHRRVNNAFLDRLQGRSQPGGLEHFGGYWNMNGGNSWMAESDSCMAPSKHGDHIVSPLSFNFRGQRGNGIEG
ncbi:Epithelial-stromal interaction protein 1 [Myotis davidii]|uniref:Epithelial-stromal interaction protein 1 n=1 Tax=Myotis davidii TaxID=225400 RepID=L5MI98_MYODS|nr:Epithelial-stromal interaction protein 1 [Myotis davidii]